MEDGKISVIVPVYQAEDYLERCVNSIRGQTYRNLEIILVDDGSTDRSPEICDRLVEQDERIVVIHKKNGGPSAARNAGLDAATGDYVSFVDSDDWLGAESYEHLMRAMEDGVQITMGGLGNCENETELINELRFDRRDRCSGEEALLAMLYSPRKDRKGCRDHMLYMTLWNKLFRIELWEKVRLEGRITEDVLALFQVYLITDQVARIPELVYYYFRRPGSLTRGNEHEGRKESLESLKRLADYATTKKLMDVCIDMRVIAEFAMLNSLVMTNDRQAYWEKRKELLQWMREQGKNGKGYVMKYQVGLFMLRYLPHLFWAYTKRKYCK